MIMSVNLNNEINQQSMEMLKEVFGEPVAHDKRTFIYDQMQEIEQSRMKELANMAEQPVIVEINSKGEIKTMSDGTQYEVTDSGWLRVL